MFRYKYIILENEIFYKSKKIAATISFVGMPINTILSFDIYRCDYVYSKKRDGKLYADSYFYIKNLSFKNINNKLEYFWDFSKPKVLKITEKSKSYLKNLGISEI